MCDSAKEQANLQKMSVQQMSGRRNGFQVGPHQRRKKNPIQKLLQEKG